jgi:hypothetical protein
MNTGTYDFELQQGASFSLSFQWKTLVDNIATVVNITGYHIRWQFVPKDNNFPSFEWSDQGTDPVFIVDTVNKKFILDVPSTLTSAYTFTNAAHELEIIAPSGRVYRFLKGTCTIAKERQL